MAKVWLPFLKSLPFFIEKDSFRAVHACWHPAHIECLRHQTLANEDFLIESSIKGSLAYKALKTCLKGIGIWLPKGYSFIGHNGNTHKNIRTRWWERNPESLLAKDVLFPAKAGFLECPMNADSLAVLPSYDSSELPPLLRTLLQTRRRQQNTRKREPLLPRLLRRHRRPTLRLSMVWRRLNKANDVS